MDWCLKLKQIKNITDEDFLKVFSFIKTSRVDEIVISRDLGSNAVEIKYTIKHAYGDTKGIFIIWNSGQMSEDIWSNDKTRYLKVYDYLRSKGYALPYMEYSVEDLVNAGIYKILD